MSKFLKYVGIILFLIVLMLPSNTMAKTSDWIEFPSQSNVPLDKEWIVSFSDEVTYDKIVAATIWGNGEFIPTTISKNKNNRLYVKATNGFSSNTKYTLRIILENGKRYKMDFETTKSPRFADQEPNNHFVYASRLDKHETVRGKIEVGDVDYYKIEIPTEGRLNINIATLNENKLNATLYGKNFEERSLNYINSRNQINFSYGSQPGIYYLKVEGTRNNEIPYEIETTFTKSTVDDEGATASFINATPIRWNEEMVGTIGYAQDFNNWNEFDVYKLEIKEQQKVRIRATSLDDKYLTFSLFNENYNKGSLDYHYSVQTGLIERTLSPGTYYVRVSVPNRNNYQSYSLKVY